MIHWARRFVSLVLVGLLVCGAVAMAMVISFAFHGLEGQAVGGAASKLQIAAYICDGILALVFSLVFLRWGWRKREPKTTLVKTP